MFLLILVAALFLGPSGTIDAQAGRSRRTLPRVGWPPIAPPPTVAEDIESVLLPSAQGGLMNAAERLAMRDTLEAQRRIWDRRRPREYLIRVLAISDCIEIRTGTRAPGEMRRTRLVVRDTTIVRREPAPMPAAYEQRCLLERRVDDLFAEVCRALEDTTARLSGVNYDEAYGFPRAYWLARGYDRGGGVLVESFAPSP